MRNRTLVEAFQQLKSESHKGVTFINDSGEDSFLSYKSLYEKALVRLSYLRNVSNLTSKDQLIFQIEDNREFIISFWACLLGNITPIPLTFSNNPETITKLLNVWEVVGNCKMIMPSKLVRKLKKSITEFNSNTFTNGELFFSKITEIETIKEWENSNPLSNVECANVTPNDIAFIQFSSGSTGDPKGVILTHNNIITNIYDISKSSEWSEVDKSLSWMPLTHDMGLIGLHLTPLVLKCNQYLMSTFLFAFYPLSWMQKVSEYDITITSCPNFGYEHFLSFMNSTDSLDMNLSSLRFILNGAEPISYKICQTFLAKLKKYHLKETAILPVYGLAEGTLAITNNPLHETIKTHIVNRTSLKLGSKVEFLETSNDLLQTTLVDLGIPVGDVQIDIRDEKGKSLPDECVGLIYIKGENVTSGYYNNPNATKKLFAKDKSLNTGDLGFIKNKRLVIIGRQKEVLFVNGQNFYANDLERLAQNVNRIENCKVAVIGIENEETKNDDLILFVQYKELSDEFISISNEIHTFITKQIGITLKEIIPIKKMPLTTSGKVQRFALKESYCSGEYKNILQFISQHKATSISTKQPEIPLGNEIENVILNCWNRFSNNTIKIGIHDNFFEAGGDSLLVSKVANHLETVFPNQLAVTDFFAYPTISKLAHKIREKQQNSTYKIKTVPFLPNQIVTNSKGYNNWRVKFENEILNSILQKNATTAEIEQLFLTCFAFITSKITEQGDITIYLAKNKKNTFLPCEISINNDEGFFKLLNKTSQFINQCDSTKEIVLENLAKASNISEHKLSLMIIRNNYSVLHDYESNNRFDAVVIINHDKEAILDFSFHSRLKKEVAQVIIKSFETVLQKLATHIKSNI